MIAELINLTRRLYPRGRAFRLGAGTDWRKLHEGLAVSEDEALSFTKSILNQILPDNAAFSDEDAAAWEQRLQLTDGAGLPLEDRKAALTRKLRHPGGTLGRQAAVYLEGELIAAGFNAGLRVYENKFGGVIDRINYDSGGTVHGGNTVHGNAAGSGTSATGVVISQLRQDDERPDAQTDLAYRSTFIIAADPYPSAIDIDAAREREFRNLILKLKPAHTHCFLIVNYV